MRAWLIRHGESENNLNGLWTGWLDVSLTDKGKSDAQGIRELLSRVSFDKIYSSDLIRARATAEIAIPGCKYETDPLLREINVGNIAGLPSRAVLDSNNQPRNKDGYSVFGGESKGEFCERVSAFMEKLADTELDNVAVFTHAGWIRRFLDLAIGGDLPHKNICLKNCTVAVFEYKDSVWKLHSWINSL